MRKSISQWEMEELKSRLKTVRVTIPCGVCNIDVVNIRKNKHGIELPWCEYCDIYFVPRWELYKHSGKFEVSFVPKTASDNIGDPQTIPHKKERSIPENLASNKITSKDVRGQILAIFNQKKRTVQMREFINQIDATRQAITNALKKLINEGLVIKVKHGHYRLEKR